MAGTISISLVESQKQIEELIARELSKIVRSIFKEAAGPIKSAVKKVVHRAIVNCPEMQSLNGGVLQWDLGLTGAKASAYVDKWGKAVAESVDVQVTKPVITSKTATGGIIINVQPGSYDNRPMEPLSSIWDGDKEAATKAAELDAVLLTWGDRLLVVGYDIEYGAFGRSGGAHMVGNQDGGWGISRNLSRVPPEYAGTLNDNFVTRALEGQKVQVEIENVILSNLRKSR